MIEMGYRNIAHLTEKRAGDSYGGFWGKGHVKQTELAVNFSLMRFGLAIFEKYIVYFKQPLLLVKIGEQ